jgi:DNA polymerase III epsilon subunit-like protein
MIIFDTETTGLPGPDAMLLDKQPHIIEFAAVKLDDETLVQTDEIEFLSHPGMRLPDEIIKITGITDADLADKKPFSAWIPKLQEFFLGERIIIAHNCEFDCKLLEINLRRNGKQYHFPWPIKRFCTVEATTHIKGYRLKLADLYNLATDGGAFKDAHRAINDVKALAVCVRWMKKEELL